MPSRVQKSQMCGPGQALVGRHAILDHMAEVDDPLFFKIRHDATAPISSQSTLSAADGNAPCHQPLIDEAGRADDVHPLIDQRLAGELARRQQQIGEQDQHRAGPADDLDRELASRRRHWRRQPPQHVVKDAARAEIFELVIGIDAAAGGEAELVAVVAASPSPRRPGAAGCSATPMIVKVSSPVEAEARAHSRRRWNCSGSTPMPTRFERWMRSKLSAITARTPSRIVPLAAQSRELPVPYSLPAMTTSGVPSCL